VGQQRGVSRADTDDLRDFVVGWVGVGRLGSRGWSRVET
jgi:hypothetical protein